MECHGQVRRGIGVVGPGVRLQPAGQVQSHALARAPAQKPLHAGAGRGELAPQPPERRPRREAAAAEARRLEGERIAAERRAAEEKERAAREEAARVEAKRQAKEREAQRISHENSPPSTDDVVALVAKHYDVSESAARHWLAEMFGIQQAA